MAKQDRLPARKRRFVAAMMTSSSVAAAARAIGVHERTGHRYMQDPRVKAALSHKMDSELGSVARIAVNAMTDALATLEAIHKDETAPASARVSAAKVIFEGAPKLRDTFDLAERVQALEEVLSRVDVKK